jgi:iron complex transport system substrate-binding protein
MRDLPTLLLTLSLLLVSPGCRQSTTHSDHVSPGGNGKLLEVVDDLGRTVQVPQPVRRIVTLAPACTEVLFAVGAGEEVVGVTSFSNYPPEAQSRTQVGGLTRETMSMERVLELRPDVIFAAGTLQYSLIQDLTALGLAVVAFEPHDIAGIIDNLQLAGEITGNKDRAAEVAAEIERDVDQVIRQIAKIPAKDRPAVFYEVWHRPLRTAGPSSYLGQLVELAGGRNIFDDLSEAYPLVSEEAVVQRNPEVILGPQTPASDISEFQRRSGWQSMAAIRAGRIHFLDEDLVSRPGPRVALGLKAIAAALHPDRFASELQKGTDR